ncbi:MAG: hypothetical protein DLM70_03215, partial [Chloroflexi bacterium]
YRGECLRSEGDQRPLEYEVPDGFDTLEWVIAQPWCDARIAMFGDSYLGFTSLAAAVSGHPALKAIAPRMIGTDRAVDHGGVFSMELVEWAVNYQMDNRNYARRVDWSVVPLCNVIDKTTGRRCPAYERLRALIVSGQEAADQAFFGVSNPRGYLRIPTLHWTGYWDLRATACIDDYLDLRSRPDVADLQWLILDAIDHEFYPVGYDGPPAGLGEAPSDDAIETLLPSYTDAIIDFFDRHVRQSTGTHPPRVRWHLAHAGWRSAPDWPPPEVKTVKLFLSCLAQAAQGPDGGRLSREHSTNHDHVNWIHNPSDPVPNNVENPWSILSNPPDEAHVELRPDVLTFTTEPLVERLDVAGPVEVHVKVASQNHSAHLVAKLVDIDESGRGLRVLLGARAVTKKEYGKLISVSLGHAGYRFRTGHRIRLELAASCFPFFEVHPGTEEDPWTATSRVPAEMTLLPSVDTALCLLAIASAES